MPTPAKATPIQQGTLRNALRYLGLDPSRVEAQALVAVAQRYNLDPLLGEVQLIERRGVAKVYISRDGMLTIAHRSGQLDGIVVDEERRNSTNDGFTCYVSVWRKDMSHPFTYGAQCKDNEDQGKAGKGPEMALARAERRALKRAFAIVSDDGEAELDDAVEPKIVEGAGPASGEGEPPEVAAPTSEVSPDTPALPAPSTYDTWALRELVDELRNRGLEFKGTKSDLAQRLIDDDTERATSDDPSLLDDEAPF